MVVECPPAQGKLEQVLSFFSSSLAAAVAASSSHRQLHPHLKEKITS